MPRIRPASGLLTPREDPFMRNVHAAACIACAIGTAFSISPADAHVVVGDRVFPVTLTFDDPGVGDEATLPQFVYEPGAGGQTCTSSSGNTIRRSRPTRRSSTIRAGMSCTAGDAQRPRDSRTHLITGKWQSITIPKSENVVSLGVISEFGGNAATQSIGGDVTGADCPTVLFRPGAGALPIGMAAAARDHRAS